MKLIASFPLVAVITLVACDAFQMPRVSSSISRRNVFESLTNSAFGIIIPTVANSFPSETATAFVPLTCPKETIMSTRLNTPVNGTSTATSAPTAPIRLLQTAPRQVIINTKSTIQLNFFGYIDRGEFTNLLNSYNSFNTPTRTAANTLAAQYNQAARRDTLFAAMTAMASAAQQQNATLCRNKTQATINAINDFLAHVGN